jgi:hypothetical protein
MSDGVWLSVAMHDPRHLRPLTHSFSDTEERMNYARDCRTRNDAGEPLGSDCFPQMIFPSEYSKSPRKSLPNLFFAGSFWALSERTADVLRQFDLGQCALYPVKVVQKDKVTPIGNHEWFCINFGNVKRAFLREHSDPTEFRIEIGGKPTFSSIIKDDACAVSSAALEGPDIWIDPGIDQGIFLSGRLGTALQRAKCASGWGLRRCGVIGF